MSRHFSNTQYSNTDALEIIQRELQQGINKGMESLADTDNAPGTFGEMQRRLQNNSFFLQNEKAKTFRRIDEYKEIYHPDRIARNKQEATEKYVSLGAEMVKKAKEETVVLLSKGEIDSKMVRVEFSLEDMDMSDFQDKATYSQIKAYVLEKHGLKASSLNIAQVKQKCGIIERENYNMAKSEDARQPKCPAEKEKVILDAMKHFGMIKNQ